MKDLLDNAPKIIAEVAKCPLGIVALIILAGSTLAWFLFDEAPYEVRAVIFIFIILAFVFPAKVSFDHGREKEADEKPDDSMPVLREQTEDERPSDASIEVSETFAWVDPNDKYNRYELTRAEPDMPDALKGKPDVRWSAELIKSTVLTRTTAPEGELDTALASLERKGYLRRNADSVFTVLPLAVEYPRATEELPVHEIDEADYWDGT